MNTASGLSHFQVAFAKLGWFIPPFAQMGFLSEIAGAVLRPDSKFSEDDLERKLSGLYEPHGMAAMVTHRYPVVPFVSNYAEIIAEAVEAHFLGLHHVAVAGLIPVIEGAGRQLLESRKLTGQRVKNVFAALADDCKRQVVAQEIGTTDEVVSMLDSFTAFTSSTLYSDSKINPPPDGTNRHGITHGHFQDSQYGSPLNFYKTIGAVNFLMFIASFNASMSWFAPDLSERSEFLAAYYGRLKTVRQLRPAR